MTQKMMSYQLPKICFRCGEKQGVKTRLIRVSQISGMGYYVVAVSVKRSNYSFSVPICDDCSEILERSDNRKKIFRILVSLLVAFGGFYFFNFGGYFYLGLIIAILVYIFAHLTFVNRPPVGDGLGGFTGQYFWFANRNFFKQFAELNPQFVSPLHLQQLATPFTVSPDPGFVWTRSNKILVFVVLMCVLFFLAMCVMVVLNN